MVAILLFIVKAYTFASTNRSAVHTIYDTPILSVLTSFMAANQ